MEDIEEIISDVFCVLWQNQSKLEQNRKMSLYLAGITRNIISKKMRKVKINDNIDEFEEKFIIQEGFEIDELEKNNIIVCEINKLKQQDKEIFMNYYYYSRSVKEIAICLNVSESKVKTRLFRIRKKIQKELENGGHSYNG